jgi:hypothetical protein
LAFFPKRLPKQNNDANKMEEVERLKEEEKKEKDETMENVFKQTTTEFTEAFKRLLTNKLFMYNFFSSLVSDQFNLTVPTVSFLSSFLLFLRIYMGIK